MDQFTSGMFHILLEPDLVSIRSCEMKSPNLSVACDMFGTLPLFSFTFSCMDYALMHPGSLLPYAGNNHKNEAGSVGSLLCFERLCILESV